MSSELVVRKDAPLAERTAAVEAAVERLLLEIPYDPDAGMINILESILTATTLDELDRPWAINGLGQFVDQVVQIDRISRMPSDYRDGYSWYVVAEGVVVETGEALSFSTSSKAIITQLILARRAKLLPAKFIVRVADEPTEAGYYPQHLEVYREYHTARRQPKAIAQAGAQPRPAGGVDPRVRANADRLARQRDERAQAATDNSATIAGHVDRVAGATTVTVTPDADEPGF